MKKYKNKYRIESARAYWWDYGWNGAYFVTICTQNRRHWFGEIRRGIMGLSEYGIIAHQCWIDIPHHFPFVKLDAHVIMPNHVHGIIIIDKTDGGRDADADVETQNFASLPNQRPNQRPTPKNQFGPQSKNLASIVRGYKIGVTKNARLIHPDFAWQPRFHDHIIRNNDEFDRIANYIHNNPLNWDNDKFYG